MTTNPDHFRRCDPVVGGEQYLEAAIRTASPARLRLMLIERAIEVSSRLAEVWRNGETPGSNEHSLKLLELLSELLSGVVGGKSDGENAICQKVADLYVFLSQHLIAAESSSDAGSIDEIRIVLAAEAETWRAVCAQEVATPATAASHAVSPRAGGFSCEA
jgi:flagellar protein FliS